MTCVSCDGRSVELGPGQTVLDALTAAGIEVPSSCRAGACQACLVQATRGTPPPVAQVGLKDSLRAQGYFLACQARPEAELEISLRGAASLDLPARVARVTWLARDVLQVELESEELLACRAGQYLTLLRADGLARAYSVASVGSDQSPRTLELHVRVLTSGRMSGWLASPEAVGARVHVRGPAGDCFYVPGSVASQPLLLIGTGTGLAPLWGVLNDALANGHMGSIELWHGARDVAGLYLTEELRALAARYPQLSYRPAVLEGDASSALSVGRLDALVLASAASFAGRRVFLCGDPGLVQGLKKQLFLKGASLKEIHADAFVGTP